MKGDFSKWKTLDGNLNGVLHQQGRVLLDRDWNDQTRITNQWQDHAAKDIIGPDVLAIPAQAPKALRLERAKVDGSQVILDVLPGHGWADGLAVHLEGDAAKPQDAVARKATYLSPPFNVATVNVGSINAGVRDAVILEIWREALNAFQVPEDLIEPALGGIDTTERVHTGMRYRLLRLDKEDTCSNLAAKLKDDDSQKGRLTVTLQPTNVIAGDCPVVEGGGYVGFEHALFRIEIAKTDSAQDMFKWSQFGGGQIVGLSKYNATEKKFTITNNDQAIKMSGLTDFYLEVIEWDDDSAGSVGEGYWRVIYGAEVTLDDNDLKVTTEHLTATTPSNSEKVFIRLWNGIGNISKYPVVAALKDRVELADGIQLQFGTGDYRPGDYWTFDVRAGEIKNAPTLIDNKLPQGIEYHRLPVAILNWNLAEDVSFKKGEIDDCRDVFRPLTKQTTCCTLTVGDGVSTFGDFNTFEEALRHLPKKYGGDICLLPGRHEINAVIENRVNIKIKGCDQKTLITPRQATSKQPIFTVKDSQGISFEHLDLVTLEGTAIHCQGSAPDMVRDICIRHNRILAAYRGIELSDGLRIEIRDNIIRLLDKQGADVGIYLQARSALVERNNIGVIPAGTLPQPDPDDDDPQDDPTEPCIDPLKVYGNLIYLWRFVAYVWAYLIKAFFPSNPYVALGGIQLAGGSENVRILENVIIGGAGNGITLGSGLEIEVETPSEPAEEETPQESMQVNIREDLMTGFVMERGKELEGMPFQLINKESGSTIDITSKDSGYYSERVAPGFHEVESTHPKYKISNVQTRDMPEFGESYDIELEQIVEPEQERRIRDLIAFIREVSIDQNMISNMGLSGIGIPELDLTIIKLLLSKKASQKNRAVLRILPRIAQLTGGFSGFVVNLEIYRNHIFNCLQNFIPINQREAGAARPSKGVGGVSLGLCQGLSIRENRVEKNGRSHLDAVCGIYVGLADRIDISQNQVLNNGPLNAEGREAITSLRPGRRGGIVLNMVTAINSLSRLGQKAEDGFSSPDPAVRIHDNVVNQPAGQALFMQAYGPVSVVDNYFNSEVSDNSAMGILAGAVLINMNGGSGIAERGLIREKYSGEKEIRREDAANLPSESEAGSDDDVAEATPASLVINRNVTDYKMAAYRLSTTSSNVLYNNNQTRNGPLNLSTFSQVIHAKRSDISFSDNQSQDFSRIQRPSEAFAELPDQLMRNANTFLWGATVRANSCRFEDPQIPITDKQPPFASLIAISKIMNTTTLNQADHCILTHNYSEAQWPSVEMGNRVLDRRGCEERNKLIKSMATQIEQTDYQDVLRLYR